MIWNEKTLDGYLENPAQFMPGNHMTFPGIPDEKVRKGIIAFLKQSDKTQAGSAGDQRTAQSQMGGMSGMQRGLPNLKTVEASSRIKTISYCHDTFKVTTVDGKPATSGNAIFALRQIPARKVRIKMHQQSSTPE